MIKTSGLKPFFLGITKHTKLCNKGVFFSSLLSCNFDDQLSQKFPRFLILCKCLDTLSENTGLWQLPKVSSALYNTFHPLVIVRYINPVVILYCYLLKLVGVYFLLQHLVNQFQTDCNTRVALLSILAAGTVSTEQLLINADHWPSKTLFWASPSIVTP